MMRVLPALPLLILLTGLAPGQPPGGKSLAELVRERFEEHPARTPLDETPPHRDAPETADPSRETPVVPTETPAPAPAPEPIPEPEPEPEPPQVDVADIPLPDFAPASEVHEIKSGDTLEKITRATYGAGTFAPVLQEYNKLNPRRLQIGQKVKTPPLATYLRELSPGAVIHYPEEMALLLEMIEEFTKLRTEIGTEEPTEEHKKALTSLQKKVTKTREQLGSAKEGVSRKPTRVLSQLKTFHRFLGQTAEGKQGTPAKNLVSAHTHLVLAFNETIAWGKRLPR